jgi:hypothetical protein
MDGLSAQTLAKLEKFAIAANKNSLHPLDRGRWREFIIAAHRERAPLYAEDLEKWLIKKGWREEKASVLAIEYEHSHELLVDYDGVIELPQA